MSNTTLTHQMIAREAAAILAEESPFLMNVNKGRQSEFGSDISGYKKGAYVDIKIPPTGKVFSGATFAEGGSASDVTEQSVRLNLDTQKHIGISFTAKEKALELTEFSERVLRPQIRTLSSVIEADLILKAVQATGNIVTHASGAGNIPISMKTYSQARAKLENYLTPAGDRSCLFSSDANVELIDASKALFHSKDQLEKAFLQGYIGQAQGAKFYEHQSIAGITNGNDITGVVVSGASQSGSSLVVGGVANGSTFIKGQVFTIAGCYAAHPQTGASLGKLQQFVITADTTSSTTTVTLPIYPAMDATAGNRTIVAAPTDTNALSWYGSASTEYKQNLMFHKDAFTVAAAPLPVLAGCEGYTARMPNGLNVRVMTGGNFNADSEATRIDVLYGFAAVRPLWACRISE